MKVELKICKEIWAKIFHIWWKMQTYTFKKLSELQIVWNQMHANTHHNENSNKEVQRKNLESRQRENNTSSLEEHQFEWQQISHLKPWRPRRISTAVWKYWKKIIFPKKNHVKKMKTSYSLREHTGVGKSRFTSPLWHPFELIKL